MGPEPADPSPRPVLPRSAIILLTLACATVVAFGIAAMRGVVTPVFFAFVLTLCVHPLRRWMQARGVPRGLATGSTIAAVFALLAGFAAVLVASLAQFSALLPQYAPQLAELGASITQRLESVGFGPEQTQAVVDGFTPGAHHRIPRRSPGQHHQHRGRPRGDSDDADPHGGGRLAHACPPDPSELPPAGPGHRLQRLRRRRPPVHDRHHRPRSGPGPLQLAGPGPPAGPGRPAVGAAFLHLQLHSEHRLLHRDHPALVLRIPHRRMADRPRCHRDLWRDQQRHPVHRPAQVRRQCRGPQRDTDVRLRAVLGRHPGARRRHPRRTAHPPCPHDPPRLRPGHRLVAALDRRQKGPRVSSSSRRTTRSAPAGHGGRSGSPGPGSAPKA